MKNIPNIAIILACTFLMQYHSIELWESMVGEGFIAYMWSLTLESVALWLWYLSSDWSFKGTILHALAITTSTVVILTAFLKLSEPVTAEMNKVDTNVKMQLLNKKGVEVFGTALKGSTKYGNHKVSETSVIEAKKAIDSQRSLINEEVKNQDKDKLVLEFSVQAVALLLMMLAQIIAIQKVRNSLNKNKKEEKVEQNFEKVELAELSNRTAENQDYSEEFTKEVRKVMLELESQRMKSGQSMSAFFGSILDENKSNYTKMQKVINKETGGIGEARLNVIKEKLEELKHSN